MRATAQGGEGRCLSSVTMTTASERADAATAKSAGGSVRNSVMRERITESAARLFQTRGINGVTMQEVAAEVGLSKASIYHYYDSRDDLLRHVFGDWARSEVEKARAIAASEDDPATKLAAFIRFHLNSLVDHLDLYALSFREESELPADVRDEFRALKREHDVLVRQILREGVEARVFEPVDETLTAFAIDGMCNWIWKWYRPGTGGKPADDIAETFAHLILRGVMAGDSSVNAGWNDEVRDTDAALAYHAREIRHHTSQLELLLKHR
ncbi:TetR/AcrR family transcriptional regulator [Rhodococcus fascians]|uniref:TetR/AcrR family transcriptional regulator n=1 Tax=Rhodococcoides fascians TaxID=1828 RepID=UPI001960FD8B|nr:TetR/AcrR family transcriptional regulator [Rhodococcus fascians]MBM7244221.1 TetR family transcriptional regulator [Rhodococcus fascians]MBY3844405.1 TetR/AcrR family transcriptional regulator [Rhodococcus fascians]MBY3850351.1 TetR/AcrR family transcriptional regulator [Rhodococcus fascians]MBY3860394.1 TetR/AcrR family transcriptional regulator [Rhodococcus fascians]MBY3869330.1 TetR/AcrR family transcriptional regulator [Rhodococcus fascians]